MGSLQNKISPIYLSIVSISYIPLSVLALHNKEIFLKVTALVMFLCLIHMNSRQKKLPVHCSKQGVYLHFISLTAMIQNSPFLWLFLLATYSSASMEAPEKYLLKCGNQSKMKTSDLCDYDYVQLEHFLESIESDQKDPVFVDKFQRGSVECDLSSNIEDKTVSDIDFGIHSPTINCDSVSLCASPNFHDDAPSSSKTHSQAASLSKSGPVKFSDHAYWRSLSRSSPQSKRMRYNEASHIPYSSTHSAVSLESDMTSPRVQESPLPNKDDLVSLTDEMTWYKYSNRYHPPESSGIISDRGIVSTSIGTENDRRIGGITFINSLQGHHIPFLSQIRESDEFFQEFSSTSNLELDKQPPSDASLELKMKGLPHATFIEKEIETNLPDKM